MGTVLGHDSTPANEGMVARLLTPSPFSHVEVVQEVLVGAEIHWLNCTARHNSLSIKILLVLWARILSIRAMDNETGSASFSKVGQL